MREYINTFSKNTGKPVFFENGVIPSVLSGFLP